MYEGKLIMYACNNPRNFCFYSFSASVSFDFETRIMSTCMSTSRSNYTDMSIWKKHADHSTRIDIEKRVLAECSTNAADAVRVICMVCASVSVRACEWDYLYSRIKKRASQLPPIWWWSKYNCTGDEIYVRQASSLHYLSSFNIGQWLSVLKIQALSQNSYPLVISVCSKSNTAKCSIRLTGKNILSVPPIQVYGRIKGTILSSMVHFIQLCTCMKGWPLCLGILSDSLLEPASVVESKGFKFKWFWGATSKPNHRVTGCSVWFRAFVIV